MVQAGHSPRLLISLLRGWNYRWNNDMACDNGDLPPMYRGWYNHWLVEEVQEATSSWFDSPAHPFWISTRDFESTGETFYLVGARSNDDERLPDGDDTDIPEVDDDAVLWRSTLPPALRWLAKVEKRAIPVTRLSTDEEKNLFKNNYRRFMGESSSANVHTAIDYSQFAEWWEQQVDDLERRGEFGKGIFRKTADLLKKYAKERQKVINIACTIAG